RRTLLVFGGSRGASSINRALSGALPRLSRVPQLQIVWQTGAEDFEASRARAKEISIPVRAFAYLDQMEKAYAVADLAVCRSGAMTITELTACGVPAILIPYPHAARDHQTQNARGLVERGAAEMIADKELTPDGLADQIEILFRDEQRLRRMGRNARAFSRTNAAERIVRSIGELPELMRIKHSVAVAGAHGKTTTTSMVGEILARGDLDPTVIVGGRLMAIGAHARLGRGPYLVAEADESDGSFLLLSPTIAVITNIDEEHLDFYKGLEEIRAAFLRFVNRVPFYGTV